MDDIIEVCFNAPTRSLGYKAIGREWTILQLKEFISTWAPGAVPASHIVLRVTTKDLEDDKTVDYYTKSGQIYPLQSVQIWGLHSDTACKLCKNFLVERNEESVKNEEKRLPSFKSVASHIKKITRDIKYFTNPRLS